MKRFNWKKILSLVLVLSLVVGTLTWNKRAASAEGETVSHPTKVEIETDEHIKLTKELLNLTVSDDEPTATAQIKLTVNGANATIEQPTTGTTDIIFVMDLSNSMDDDTNGKETDDPDKQRITAAKAAAKSFASGILTDANKDVVRIGIASFGTKGHENKSHSSSPPAKNSGNRSSCCYRSFKGWCRRNRTACRRNKSSGWYPGSRELAGG